jgi:hypothetical protein
MPGAANVKIKWTRAGGGGTAPVITSPAFLVAGTVDTLYPTTYFLASGSSPITWSVTAGTLPAGMTFTTVSNQGVLAGTPTATASGSITFTATNAYGSANRTLTLTVSAVGTYLRRPQIWNFGLNVGVVGVAYSDQLVASGSTPISYSLVAGTLPGGLSLNTTTGIVSGTPTTPVLSKCIFRATNAAGFSDWSVEINVYSAAAPTIQTSAGALPPGMVGLSYSTKLVTTDSDEKYNTSTSPPQYLISWSIASGSLPSGLSVDQLGVISGTPSSTATNSPVVFRATNNINGASSTVSKTLTVAASDGTSTAPAITTTDASVSPATVGSSYSYTLAATGSGPITWSILQGSLEAGLSFNTSTGAITGTPSVAGPVSVVFQAANAASSTIKELRLTKFGVPTQVRAPIIKVWRS